MRKGMEPFRTLQLLRLPEQQRVESLACSDESLYIGTADGTLLQYDLAWPGGEPGSPSSASATRRAAVHLSPKRPVEQVCVSHGQVLVLVDGVISALPAADVQAGGREVLCREAKRFCIHTGQEKEHAHQLEVCVSLKKKLVLWARGAQDFEQRQEFPTADAAQALVWHQSWICAGFRREYHLYSDRVGVPSPVCQLDGKMTPQMAVASGQELILLVQESVGLFFNLSTQQPSPKNTLTWPRKVTSLGVAGTYAVGSTGSGQVDVFSMRDCKNCQTLTVEAPVTAICNGGSRAYLAAEGGITCLDPVPLERQLQKLLEQLRFNDALELLNANLSVDHPDRQKQLSRCHEQAAWALFCDLQFIPAFQHFLYTSELRLERILLFWASYLPAPSQVGASAEGETVPGAPSPQDIRDFVRQRLREKDAGEAAEASEAAVAANVDLANSALVPFLQREREALVAEVKVPPEHRPKGAADPGPLLGVVDTVLLKLLVETDDNDLRLQELLDAGVYCKVEECEAYLRQHRRLDVLARLWKAQGMHEMVLQELSALLGSRVGGGLPASAEGHRAPFTMGQIASEMADTLRAAIQTPAGLALLRRYVPELLAVEPPAVLPIFVGGQRPAHRLAMRIPIDDVLQLLQGHNELVLGFLEQEVLGQPAAEARHQAQLATSYLAQIAEERKGGGARLCSSPSRQKLLGFLEVATGLDFSAIRSRVEALELHEEQVVLRFRESRHLEALQLLVVTLNDLPRAETYCRIVCRRDSGGQKAQLYTGDLPAWARSVVFSPKGSIAAAAAASASASADPERGALDDAAEAPSGGAATKGPFMIFLQVLLDVGTAAAQQPDAYPKVAAEYKEAALALLVGYVGHKAMAPQEVLAALPADWTLEDLSPYLTKCARASLHERRASMLEEHLSSMAYLKTLNAWAQERTTRVCITGDRCCPVCHRRFVDKDLVGKAFLAYPNETCVHLNCSQDLSVCPKTGRSFADNLSVFCNALDLEGAE